jgi:CitMHS family citrate-Mg2+:H+ or citrate-Ca2+:H+ symporter
MLSLLTLAMLVVFMTLIVTGRASPMVALVVTPIVFAVIGGFGLDLGPMMAAGVQRLAPLGVMLCFAILYFSIMSDAGLFDPLIRWIVKIVDHDPVRITTGTAVLALFVSLDGDGSTTYIICCSALLPLYRRVGLNPLILACLLTLSCAITNITPWGGPTARVASALQLQPEEVFLPLIPSMLGGAIFVICIAYLFGVRERKRLALIAEAGSSTVFTGERACTLEPTSPADAGLRRPKLVLLNLVLTLLLLAILARGVIALPVLFIIATIVALIVNYPSLQMQSERLVAHAPNVVRVIALVFASGIFVGILEGTGMTKALADSMVQVLPPRLGPYLAPITGALSMPSSFFMTNTAFFYGVVPVLAETASHYGTSHAEMARAALLDGGVHFLSPVTPSTYLLVSLVGVEFAKHQRFSIPWALGLWVVMLIAAMLTGAVSLRH